MRHAMLTLITGGLCILPGSLTTAAQPGTPPPVTAAEAPPAAAAINPLIGKAPPPITVARWIKGEPLTKFEKGKVYIIDFWATWCGPCKAAIPHLTKLAQKHTGKLEVIGISISERQKDNADTSYFEVVEKFVTKMDNRMDYRVAVDTPDKQMHTSWFKPSNTGGIPTAWIIDGNGLVAWIGIGSPNDVERIAEAVMAGTFDISKETELQVAAERAAEQRSKTDITAAKEKSTGIYAKFPGYKQAMDRGDQAAALASLEAAFKADPTLETGAAYQWKFMILLQRNKPEEVNLYVRELLQRYPTNDDIMGFTSACIVSTSDDARFDKQLALETATKAAALAKPDTRWAQHTKWRLGWAHFQTGDKAKAIENMQAALDGVNKLKGTFDFGDLATECEEALKQFRKAVK